jgi:hypothetical protein
MKKYKKFSLFLIPLLLLWVYQISPRIAAADDDENDYGEIDNEENESPAVAPVIETAAASGNTAVSQPKTTYVTVTDPPTYVTEIKTETITKIDSDQDGLIDEIDPNPTIPEYYIVQDSNNNGISDLFEYGK